MLTIFYFRTIIFIYNIISITSVIKIKFYFIQSINCNVYEHTIIYYNIRIYNCQLSLYILIETYYNFVIPIPGIYLKTIL